MTDKFRALMIDKEEDGQSVNFVEISDSSDRELKTYSQLKFNNLAEIILELPRNPVRKSLRGTPDTPQLEPEGPGNRRIRNRLKLSENLNAQVQKTKKL